jgi:SAM-dependent methyltransferase
MDPKRIVEDGYDAIADRFGEWRAAIKGSPDDEWLDVLLTKLPKQADVLELGAGQGSVARPIVAAGHRYVGVDISAEQVRRARELVPEAEFRHGDAIELELGVDSLDAVIALYTFNHLPRAELPTLLSRIAASLRVGGYLLATFGRSGREGVEDDFLGVPMFFGSYPDDETQELLLSAGFELERVEVVSIEEPEGPASFLWILAAQTRFGAGPAGNTSSTQSERRNRGSRSHRRRAEGAGGQAHGRRGS